MNLQCPIDHEELQKRETAGRDFYYCAQCHGHYVPAELFPEARAASAVQLHLQQKQAFSVLRRDGLTLISPCHAQTMQTLFFRGVEIDVCPECLGFWLDQGELEKMGVQVRGEKENDPEILNKQTIEAEKNHAKNLAHSDSSDASDAIDVVFDLVDSFISFND